MNRYLSQLNPTERRFVVGVGLVFFVILNWLLVWPHFSDWNTFQNRLAKARTTQNKYDETKQKAQRLEAELRKMESSSAAVPPEDQAIEFQRTIMAQTAQAGVGFQGIQKSTTRTNQFFIEQIQTFSVISGEKQLVDFLFNLGSGGSLIRVRDLSVRPDQPRFQLNANVTLVASYQKKSRSQPAPPAHSGAAPVAAPAPKPTTPAVKLTSKPAVPVIPALATNKSPVTVKTSTPAARMPTMPSLPMPKK